MNALTDCLSVLGGLSTVAALAAAFLNDDLVDPLLALGNGLFAVEGALQGDWVWSAISGALALLFALAWRRKRRNRKRSAKLIGAKSRALIAAMVARMRETAKPRPVLRPGGARA